MPDKKQESYIINHIKNVVAALGNDKLEIFHYDDIKNAGENLSSIDQMQAAVIDVTSDFGFELARRIRSRSAQTEIMIVADISISPIRYLNPKVKASALLLKPFEKEKTIAMLRSFIRQFVISKDTRQQEDYFYLKKRGEDVAISFYSILYFEARDKKLYINCGTREYVIYDSLDSVHRMLPDYFIKCHRSFLVNRRHIQDISFTEGSILLDNGESIPLSRAHKNMLREVLRNE